MKKIINGKRYDTTKATRVASADQGGPASNFEYWEESLYRSPRGIWYLVGEGGPLSRYARHVGNEAHGGSDLIPLTPEQAREWLERYGTAELVEEHFGDEIEDA